MSTAEAPKIVSNYLAQLARALVDVPAGIAQDILEGISEELAGLDEKSASEKIALLGDPRFIATEARGGSEAVLSADGTSSLGRKRSSATRSRGFALAAVVLIAVGGVLVPVVGWVVGVFLVWLSQSWRVWEKLVATLAGPTASVAIIILAAVASHGVIHGQALLGAPVLVTTFALIVPNAVVALWLLWRIREN